VSTRAQVRRLLEEGHSYETAALALGIPAGQAYMIATGVPADGSAPPAPGDGSEPWLLPGSSQHLSNPPPFNPTRNDEVMAWVHARASHDLKQAT
jgi:hypothetical protein